MIRHLVVSVSLGLCPLSLAQENELTESSPGISIEDQTNALDSDSIIERSTRRRQNRLEPRLRGGMQQRSSFVEILEGLRTAWVGREEYLDWVQREDPFRWQKLKVQFDPNSLTGADRVALARLMTSSVAPEQWCEQQIRRDTGVRTLDEWIGKHYRLESEEDQSVRDALAAEIIKANGDANFGYDMLGETLRIPPFPVARVEDRVTWNKRVAVYDAATSRYFVGSINDDISAFRPVGTSCDRTATELGFFGFLTGEDVTEVHIPRDVPGADVLALPPSFVVGESTGRAILRLASSSYTGQFVHFDHPSPFRELALSRIELLTDADKEQLKRRASSIQFWVIDVGFHRDNGHGRLVREAISDVLEIHNAGFLNESVYELDLDPAAPKRKDTPTLKDLLTDYSKRIREDLNSHESIISAPTDEAKSWLRKNKNIFDGPGSNFALPEYLVYAAIDHVLLQTRFAEEEDSAIVISISATLFSKGLEGYLRARLNKVGAGRLLVFAAAGKNVGWEMVAMNEMPQGLSNDRPEIINVAGLDCGGTSGTAHSPQSKTPPAPSVRVLASGCGLLDVDAGEKGFFGSSVATPAVATSIWLRALLDRSSSTLPRRLLSEASLPPLPTTRSDDIESYGVFDVSYSIANPRSHAVTVEGYLLQLEESCQIDIGIPSRGRVVRFDWRKPPVSAKEHKKVEISTLKCGPQAQDYCVWTRTFTAEAWSQPTLAVGPADEFNVSFEGESYNSAQEFHEKVHFLSCDHG